jgi:hypothetical protein
VPIYVYRDPQHSTEGEIQVWQMTAPQWKKFSDLAVQVDLGVYDLMLTAAKRGYGMDLSYSAVPDVRMRDYWSAEQKEQLAIATQSFYQMGESSLATPMALNEWNELLYSLGYDFQNMCWPGGQSPMNPIGAMGAVRGGLAAPGLPQVPRAGMAAPGFPGQVGGALFQPPPPQAAPVGRQALQPLPPAAPGVAAPVPPLGQVPSPQAAPPVPGPVVSGNGVGLGVPGTSMTASGVLPAAPAAPAAQGSFATQTVSGAAPVAAQTVPGAVPLGTVPVIPASKAVPPAAQAVPAPSAPSNEIPGVQEITDEEFKSMLS